MITFVFFWNNLTLEIDNRQWTSRTGNKCLIVNKNWLSFKLSTYWLFNYWTFLLNLNEIDFLRLYLSNCVQIMLASVLCVSMIQSLRNTYVGVNLHSQIVELDKLDTNTPRLRSDSLITHRIWRESGDGPTGEDSVRERPAGGQQEETVSAEPQGESWEDPGETGNFQQHQIWFHLQDCHHRRCGEGKQIGKHHSWDRILFSDLREDVPDEEVCGQLFPLWHSHHHRGGFQYQNFLSGGQNRQTSDLVRKIITI